MNIDLWEKRKMFRDWIPLFKDKECALKKSFFNQDKSGERT